MQNSCFLWKDFNSDGAGYGLTQRMPDGIYPSGTQVYFIRVKWSCRFFCQQSSFDSVQTGFSLP